MLTVVLSLGAIVAGLFLLENAAERFTAALGEFARQLHASESVVGLLTAGGEWEELVVVGLALWSGHPGLAVGNIIGSCVANLIGSMPLGLLGPKPLVPDRSARIYAVVMLAVTALAVAVLADGTVERRWGGLLVAVFFLYVVSIVVVVRRGWLQAPADDDDEADESGVSVFRVIAVMLVGLVLISVGAELVVQGGVRLAHEVGLSDYAVGATIVAIGTTLPDKAISLIGGLRGQGGVVTANATGSNIFLLTLVLGLSVWASGGALDVGHRVAVVDAPLLLVVSGLVVLLLCRPSLHRGTGIGLLALYAAYLSFVLARGT